jgi:hypothetical protein
MPPPGAGASVTGVGVASGAVAGRALGSGTADIGKAAAGETADGEAADGEATSAMAITFGRWRGSGIRPVSGATAGKSVLVPSLEVEVA